MIQIRNSAVIADRDTVERLRSEFTTNHCTALPRLLDPALLDYLARRLTMGQWNERAHGEIAFELTLDDDMALNVLAFLSNAPSFLEVTSRVTAVGPMTFFNGRVYRLAPNSGHFDSWHGDSGDGGRLVGMSINLSPHGYQGGIFQLRERTSKRVLVEIANTGWGDAILFRISKALEHQVTEVVGENARTAYAGWFHSGPKSLFTLVRERSVQQEG
jgi:hypothetical protein